MGPHMVLNSKFSQPYSLLHPEKGLHVVIWRHRWHEAPCEYICCLQTRKCAAWWWQFWITNTLVCLCLPTVHWGTDITVRFFVQTKWIFVNRQFKTFKLLAMVFDLIFLIYLVWIFDASETFSICSVEASPPVFAYAN